MRQPPRKKDPKFLSPNFKKKFELRWKEVKKIYPNARIFETLRTKERQKWLYGIWRTHSLHRKPVTRTMSSRHMTGEAVDVVFLNNGKIQRAWPYDKIIELSKKYWIRNLSPRETCHFEDDWTSVDLYLQPQQYFQKIYKRRYSSHADTKLITKHVEKRYQTIKNKALEEQIEELIWLIGVKVEELHQKFL